MKTAVKALCLICLVVGWFFAWGAALSPKHDAAKPTMSRAILQYSTTLQIDKEAVLVTSDGSNFTVYAISPGSSVEVTPSRGSPDPQAMLTTTSADDAAAKVKEQLLNPSETP